MAKSVPDTMNTNVVAWPSAIKHLEALATRDYRLAAKAPTEFERGRFAGRAEMAEELRNLPQALALLAEEDKREQEHPSSHPE